MVNGGGVVVLDFRREPFASQQKAIRVAWNEIVLMDVVELKLDQSSPDLEPALADEPTQAELEAPICTSHNYKLMRPLVFAAPKSSRRRATNNIGQRAVILRDSAMVQQSIVLPGSTDPASSNQSVSLTYISSRANEFMSTISIQLIPSSGDSLEPIKKLPQELKFVHLKIVIEGNLFEQVFEPEINLSYTYGWNRRNVYRQKSFGMSTALVSIGYQYSDCRDIIWTRKQIQLPGHDLSISDIGNQWNLNIHHRYNYRDSILQRGDGRNFNLKTDKARVVQPVIGDGYQRQAVCPYCDGATNPAEQRLLRPQSMISSPDGSLYVADYNLIRRIEQIHPSSTTGQPAQTGSTSRGAQSERLVRTVLELPTSRVPSRYSLAMNFADQKLYLTDADRHQIYLVREQAGGASTRHQLEDNATTTSEDSLLPVVGSGIRCQLDDHRASICGDGQPARQARLVEPKAMTFDLRGRMYIADGPNVRMVDTDGRIYTILGNYGPRLSRHNHFPACSGDSVPMHKFVPRAPLDLAVSPIDDTLHVLDDNVVYKVSQDKRMLVVAGRPSHCPSEANQQENARPRASRMALQSAVSIAFNQAGDLFIGEDDQKQQISRVLVVTPDEDRISIFAGLQQESPRPSDSLDAALATGGDSNGAYGDSERASNVLPLGQATRALEYKFSSIAAITIDQQGKLIVADRMQLKIVSVEPDLPQINAAGEFEIQSPDNGDELLVFNRHGHHMATREISEGVQVGLQRGSSKYTFTYNLNTSFGQLVSINYATGNKISIYRDGPHHSVKMIETALGGQCKLDVSRNGQVHSISILAPNSTKMSFSYHVEGGLLKQSRDQASNEVFDFTYDEFGRATAIQHSSARLTSPIECRLAGSSSARFSTYLSTPPCSSLIVNE